MGSIGWDVRLRSSAVVQAGPVLTLLSGKVTVRIAVSGKVTVRIAVSRGTLRTY